MQLEIMNIARMVEANRPPVFAPAMLVDPPTALDWVTRFNYPRQRSFSPAWCNTLAEFMNRGAFRPYTVISFAVHAGQPILVNGQHTLRAIHASKLAQHLLVQFQLTETERDVERLYSGFDTQRKRSLRDHLGGIGEELDLNEHEKHALAVAVKFLNVGMRTYGRLDPVSEANLHDAEFIKDQMRLWSAEAAVYFQLLRKAAKPNRELFMRAHVIAIGLLTLRYVEAKAINFWGPAVLDDGLRIGDPRKTLINWLRTNPVGRIQGVQHRATSACWNAWFKDKELTRVMPATEAAGRPLGCEPHFVPQRTLTNLREEEIPNGGMQRRATRAQHDQFSSGYGISP